MKRIFGKEPHKGVNPDEVVADRRGHTGRRAGRRRARRSAPRRDAALAGHRNPRRRHDQAHRAEHDDPDEEEPDILDGGGQPARRVDTRAPGRARDGVAEQDAGQVRPGGHTAGAPRGAADRGGVRHRRQRHRARVGEGPGDRQGAENTDRVVQRAQRRRNQEDGEGRRDRTPRRTRRSGRRWRRRTKRTRSFTPSRSS